MYELIKIEDTTIGDESVPTVSARELHEFLESKQRFADWIKKRVKDGGFLENKDFISLHKNMPREIGATSRMLLSALASAVTEYYLNTNKYDEEEFLGKVIYPLTNGEPVNLPEFKTFNSLLFPTQVISDFEAEFHGNKTTVQTIFYVLCDIECALRKDYPDIEEHAVMHHLMTLLFKAVTNYYHNSDNFNEAEFYSDVAYAISEGEAVPIACFQEFNEEFLMAIAS